MQTLAEKLRIIADAVEGKGLLQFKLADGGWRDAFGIPEAYTGALHFTYRLKPEPEYIWRNTYKYNADPENLSHIGYSYFDTKEEAYKSIGSYYICTERFVKEE